MKLKSNLMKKLILLLCLITWSIAGYSQLLWKISGNGLKSPSYLVGTHHLAPISILDSLNGFYHLLEETKQVIGEIDFKLTQSPEFVQKMQQSLLLPGDTTLLILMSKEDFDKVNAQVKANLGMDLNNMLKMKPAFVHLQLTLSIYLKHMPGYNPAQQLDSYIQTKGLEKGLKIIGLEAPESQIDVLLNMASLQRQAELLVCLAENPQKTVEDVQTLNQAYLAQDLQKMLELSEKDDGTPCSSKPEENDELLGKRNDNWIKKLPAYLQAAPSLVVVGALHLPGEKGLIRQLQKAGYTVEAVK